MLIFIINCLFWFLAVYGIIDIVKTAWNKAVQKKINTDGIYVIVAVKNKEQQIEMFLRSTISKILYGKDDNLKSVIITDINSTDKTKEILEKFSEDHSGINVVEWESLKNKLDGQN